MFTSLVILDSPSPPPPPPLPPPLPSHPHIHHYPMQPIPFPGVEVGTIPMSDHRVRLRGQKGLFVSEGWEVR